MQQYHEHHRDADDTNGIDCSKCFAHSGIKEMIKSLEKNAEDQWKAINQIRGWVIGGMASLIFFGLTQGGEVIFKLLHLK